MLSPELLRLAAEGQLGTQPLVTEDLQFKLVKLHDEPRGFQRFFSQHGRTFRENVIPIALAAVSIGTTMSGMENLNQLVPARVVDPFYAGLAFGTVAYIVSRRLFSQI